MISSKPGTNTLADIDIVNSTSANASVTPDVPGTFVFRLDVTDGADNDFDPPAATGNVFLKDYRIVENVTFNTDWWHCLRILHGVVNRGESHAYSILSS